MNFNQQIANFTNYGTYDYKFDNVGNEILNPQSIIFQQVYFSLPLRNIIYNNDKVISFYDPTFTEFVPQPINSEVSEFSQEVIFPQEAIDKIDEITYQNTQLQSQLESLVDSSTMDSSSADIQSVKNMIIDLRIQSGQGSSEKDFQNIYPYSPISIEEQNTPT